MPDNTRRSARNKKEELVEDSKKDKKEPIDLTPVIADVLKRLTIKHDHPTQQIGFVQPAKGDEPEKFITLDEIMNEQKSLENLMLVHEVAVDDTFTLTKPQKKNSIFEMIAQTMHNAFWDKMREDLSQIPPKKEGAINLLMDIKLAFRALLTGNNDRALAHIEELLDESEVRKKIDEDQNAVVSYTKFVMDMMSFSCCKARDQAIAALKLKTDLIDRLRGIMEMLETMQLDMANYVLHTARAELTKHSIEYEKQNFATMIDDDCLLAASRAWLKRSFDRYIAAAGADEAGAKQADAADDMGAAAAGPPPEAAGSSNKVQAIVKAAYMELLDPLLNHPFPELLVLDKVRLTNMKAQVLRLTICCAVTQIVRLGRLVPNEQGQQDVADQLMILAKDVNLSDLENVLESLWLQVSMIPGFEEATARGISSEADTRSLKAEVLKLANEDSRVFSVVKLRLLSFIEDVLEDQNNQVLIPVIFKKYAEALIALAKQFRKVVRHNRAVCGDYFATLIQEF